MPYFECRICGKLTDVGDPKHFVCLDCIEDDTITDLCNLCMYNTNTYVCHSHCSGCNGKSKFVRKSLVLNFEN